MKGSQFGSHFHIKGISIGLKENLGVSVFVGLNTAIKSHGDCAHIGGSHHNDDTGSLGGLNANSHPLVHRIEVVHIVNAPGVHRPEFSRDHVHPADFSAHWGVNAVIVVRG